MVSVGLPLKRLTNTQKKNGLTQKLGLKITPVLTQQEINFTKPIKSIEHHLGLLKIKRKKLILFTDAQSL